MLSLTLKRRSVCRAEPGPLFWIDLEAYGCHGHLLGTVAEAPGCFWQRDGVVRGCSQAFFLLEGVMGTCGSAGTVAVATPPLPVKMPGTLGLAVIAP